MLTIRKGELLGDDGQFRNEGAIGRGSFGMLLRVTRLSDGRQFAAKLEHAAEATRQLALEARLYLRLEAKEVPHFPRVVYFGETPKYRIMVMELLGKNLDSVLMRLPGRRMSQKTVFQIAIQGICRLQALHEEGFLHRDIKPENFLIGMHAGPTVYLVDLGMMKPYLDPKTRTHIPEVHHKHFQGTLRFASCHQHLGFQQSRRDDMESFAYVLVYLFFGGLPWMGLDKRIAAHQEAHQKKLPPPDEDIIDQLLDRPKDKENAILQLKYKMSPAVLCKGGPPVLEEFLRYTKGLEYAEAPDYSRCRKMFRDAAAAAGIVLDGVYDWTTV